MAMIDPEAIERRLAELAALTDDEGKLRRLAFSPVLGKVNALVSGWMRQAGMDARIDAAGNVVARYEGLKPGAPVLMLGSHLDTVPDAGRFDGMLGVVVAIACVEKLAKQGRRFPFAIEVVGFGDEEGVRFGAVLAGSRAVAGSFAPASLDRQDAEGISLRDAMQAFGLDPARVGDAARVDRDVLAYIELHIEQGPVLQQHGLALGCVSSIAGAHRLLVTVDGQAGHAGTVPMTVRRDALAAAASCVQAVEQISLACGIVGTVGELAVVAGAANVIPGRVRFSVDLRAGDDVRLAEAAARVATVFDEVARDRCVQIRVQPVSQRGATACAGWVMGQIDAAIAAVQGRTLHLTSGAGHDGLFMSTITGIGMIFVRCTDGISHHPNEMATTADIAIGAGCLLRFIEAFQPPSWPNQTPSS